MARDRRQERVASQSRFRCSGGARCGARRLTDDALVTAAAEVAIRHQPSGRRKGMRLVQIQCGCLEALRAPGAKPCLRSGTIRYSWSGLRCGPGTSKCRCCRLTATCIWVSVESAAQRRHQKVIEEAPSPLLDPQTRERIGVAASQHRPLRGSSAPAR